MVFSENTQVFRYTQVRVAVHINFVNAFQKQLLVEFCFGMNSSYHVYQHVHRTTMNNEIKKNQFVVLKLTVHVNFCNW